jgi:hypothetical protein
MPRNELNKIREIAAKYYRRRDVQKNLVNFSRNREVVPRYLNSFGKRPDILQYESDVAALVGKGATSFHCSEELWHNPLELSTELNEEQLNNLRIGFDLLIDIDTRYLEYGKIATELIIEALRFHNVNSIGLKFSGGSGWHIGVPNKAFPEELNGMKVKNLFPQAPQAIIAYLKEIIYNKLVEKISELSSSQAEFVKIKDYEGARKVVPDLILVSSRHLFRMPYSLHERTGLTSIVIKPEQLKDFRPSWARPEIVSVKQFFPEEEEIEKNEARELLVQALDWYSRNKQLSERKEKEKRFAEYKEIVLKDLTPSLYPPCIDYILRGMKHDGRKRALFILLNFFRSLKLNEQEIEKKIDEWNKRNYKPLRDGYIKSQISWFKRQKAVLPPNCDKPIYKEIATCHADDMCKLVKNPVNYTIRKVKLQHMRKKESSKIGRKKESSKSLKNIEK